MKPRIAICTALLLVHLGIGLLGRLSNSQFLMDVFGGSVYYPLGVFADVGLPVFQRSGWFLPDVTPLGYSIIIALWLAIYWGIADIIVRLLGKPSRVA